MKNRQAIYIVFVLSGLVLADVNAALAPAGNVIQPPASVFADGATNSWPQGFDEVQGHILGEDLPVDGGVIAAGSAVNSHMIFLNPSRGNTININNATFVFDGEILGVMSGNNGALEVASSSFLGAPNTVYPTTAYQGRGLEDASLFPFGREGYSFVGNRLTLSVNAPSSDWVRVITKSVNALNLPPTSAPRAEPPTGFVPLEVEFFSNAGDPDGDPLAIEWDFGDGSSSNERDPTHNYKEKGTYHVTLTVSDGKVTVTDHVTVTVNAKLCIFIYKSKVVFKNTRRPKDKFAMGLNFVYEGLPDVLETIELRLDGVSVFSVPFGDFDQVKANRYRYSAKNIEAEIDFKHGFFNVKVKKAKLLGIDSSDGVDASLHFGADTGISHIDLLAKEGAKNNGKSAKFVYKDKESWRWFKQWWNR